MKRFKFIKRIASFAFLSLLASLGFAFPLSAKAETLWNLPATLSPKNTEITFEIDSTWHTVHGAVKNIEGKAWLLDLKDYRSIKVEALLPVLDLDTDNDSRDKKMRRVMDQDEYPSIRIAVNSVKDLCPPRAVTVETPCTFLGTGTITIRDITKPLSLRSTITLNADGSYSVFGNSSLLWPEFGVKDPSILIAKVDPKVSIQFKLHLSPRS